MKRVAVFALVILLYGAVASYRTYAQTHQKRAYVRLDFHAIESIEVTPKTYCLIPLKEDGSGEMDVQKMTCANAIYLPRETKHGTDCFLALSRCITSN